MQSISSYLERAFPECIFAYARLPAYPRWLFVSIIHRAASKRAAFDFLLTHYDIAPENVVSFGDAQSDMEFITMAGVGVAMGRRALVIKDLADGRLVAPFPMALPTGARFRFLCPEGTETRPQVSAFKTWILREIEKTAHIADSMTLLELDQK